MEDALIEFIRQNDFIYNKRNFNYKNTYLRDKKFDEIALKLKIPVDKVKARWRTLRDKFQREIAKSKISASGDSAKTPPKKWKWLDSLLFLADVDTENNKTTGNYSKSATVECEYTAELIDTFPDIEENNTSLDTVFSFTDSLPLSSSSRTNPSPSPTSSKTIKKNKSEVMLESASKDMKQLIEIATHSFTRPKENAKTPVRLFFDTVSQQVEDAYISPSEFGLMQIEILKVVNQFLYKNQF